MRLRSYLLLVGGNTLFSFVILRYLLTFILSLHFIVQPQPFQIMIKITEKSIDVQKIIDTVSSLSAGALNVFIGTVRNNANGKNVLWLEYEAYETMAVSQIRKIIDEASHRWPLLGWAVSHRIGTLKPGEVSVVVAVSTPHRKDSFEACQFIIDAVKEIAPIWKKEVFEDGEEWISARPEMAFKA